MGIRFVACAAFAALILAFSAGEIRAQSVFDYPWCSVRFGPSGARTCYFATHAQCMATISGISGTCERNPWYRGTPARRTRRR